MSQIAVVYWSGTGHTQAAVETGETGEDVDTEISMFYDTDH